MASSGWTPTTLGECARWVSGGTPSKKNPAYWGGAMPWVSAKDMKEFRIYDSQDHVTPEALGNGTRSVPPRSILLLVRGMTLHDDLPICMVMREMTFNQDVKALVPHEHVVPEFLAYWLLANKSDLMRLVDSASHGTGRIHTQVFKDTKLGLPCLSVQKRIADVLGKLDDKIELNRKMNRTLEKMAAAIFKSWFIDFDPVHAKAEGRDTGLPVEIAQLFPDRFEESELGLIPDGWRVGPLIGLAELVTKSITPGREPEAIWEHYGIPAYDEGQQPRRDLGATIKSGKYVVPECAVLVSKLNPQFPRTWLTNVVDPARAICSTEFMPFIARRDCWRPFLYEMMKSYPVQDAIKEHATGSTGSRQRVRPKEIADMGVISPPPNVIDAFSDIAASIHDRILLNRRQNRRLANLRDTLLPKLLSGEIELPEAKVLAEEVPS